MIPTDVHSFSRTFARQHGVTPAVLLKHLAFKVRTSKNRRLDKLWHFNSARKLQTKLPYFSSSTISATIKILESKKLLELGNFNKWPHDKTQWYHVPEELYGDVEEEPLKFDREVARIVGVLGAVLHFNLHYFIRGQVKKKLKAPKHMMSSKALTQILPFSESAIKKALNKLSDTGLIVKLQSPRSTYTLPASDLVLMKQKA